MKESGLAYPDIREQTDRFDIKPNPHGIYWKSKDGKNNYLSRFERYEAFCRQATSLGLPVEDSPPVKPDKWRLIVITISMGKVGKRLSGSRNLPFKELQ